MSVRPSPPTSLSTPASPVTATSAPSSPMLSPPGGRPPRAPGKLGRAATPGARRVSIAVTEGISSPFAPSSFMTSPSPSSSRTSPLTPSSPQEKINRAYTDLMPIPEEISCSTPAYPEQALSALYRSWAVKILHIWSNPPYSSEDREGLIGTFIYILGLSTREFFRHMFQKNTNIKLDFSRPKTLPSWLNTYNLGKFLENNPMWGANIKALLTSIGEETGETALSFQEGSALLNVPGKLYTSRNKIEGRFLDDSYTLFSLHFQLCSVLTGSTRRDEWESLYGVRMEESLKDVIEKERKPCSTFALFTQNQRESLQNSLDTLQRCNRQLSRLGATKELTQCLQWLLETGKFDPDLYPILLHTFHRTIGTIVLHTLRSVVETQIPLPKNTTINHLIPLFTNAHEIRSQIHSLLSENERDYFIVRSKSANAPPAAASTPQLNKIMSAVQSANNPSIDVAQIASGLITELESLASCLPFIFTLNPSHLKPTKSLHSLLPSSPTTPIPPPTLRPLLGTDPSSPPSLESIYTASLFVPSPSTSRLYSPEHTLAAYYSLWVRDILQIWHLDPSETAKKAFCGTFIHALELATEQRILHLFEIKEECSFSPHDENTHPDLLHHNMQNILALTGFLSHPMRDILNLTGTRYSQITRYVDSRSNNNATSELYLSPNRAHFMRRATALCAHHFRLYLFCLQRCENFALLFTNEMVKSMLTRQVEHMQRDIPCIRLPDSIDVTRIKQIPITYTNSFLIEEFLAVIKWVEEKGFCRHHYPMIIHTLHRTFEYTLLQLITTHMKVVGKKPVTDYKNKKAEDLLYYLEEQSPSSDTLIENLQTLLLNKNLDYFFKVYNSQKKVIMTAFIEVQNPTPAETLAQKLSEKISLLTTYLEEVFTILGPLPDTLSSPISRATSATPQSLSRGSAAQGPSPDYLPTPDSGIPTSSTSPLLAVSPNPPLSSYISPIATPLPSSALSPPLVSIAPTRVTPEYPVVSSALPPRIPGAPLPPVSPQAAPSGTPFLYQIVPPQSIGPYSFYVPGFPLLPPSAPNAYATPSPSPQASPSPAPSYPSSPYPGSPYPGSPYPRSPYPGSPSPAPSYHSPRYCASPALPTYPGTLEVLGSPNSMGSMPPITSPPDSKRQSPRGAVGIYRSASQQPQER